MPSKPIMGVYCIRNKTNGKRYVGSSVNIGSRWRGHRYLLRAVKHPNAHLQSAWNLYGEDCFIFEIVVRTDTVGDLLSLEGHHCALLNSFDRNFGYNIDAIDSVCNRVVSAETRRKIGDASRGRVPSLEARRRMSEAGRGRPKSENHKRKIGAAQRSVPRQGHPHTAETRARIAASQQGEKNHSFGKNLSAVHRKKISEALCGDRNPNFGKKMSEEQKRKIGEANRGRKMPLEAVEKTAAANRGRKRSEETRRKMSEARKTWWRNRKGSTVEA